MNIAIIGCGYIGLLLAKHLVQKGHHVHATLRTPKSLKEVEKVAHNTSILKGSDLEDVLRIIEHNDIIIVTVAAQSSDDYENAYLRTAKTLREAAKQGGKAKQIIYTSSSSVYGDHHGQWVDETSPLLYETPQGKILIETEQVYLSLKEFGWIPCIFRLSEIYGPDRELSLRIKNLQDQFLAGNGETYTNMAHADDIIGAIDYAILHKLSGVYNLADDDHPTRKELYNQLAKKYQLPPPKWDASLKHGRVNKRISNHSLKAKGYQFKQPHRVLD